MSCHGKIGTNCVVELMANSVNTRSPLDRSKDLRDEFMDMLTLADDARKLPLFPREVSAFPYVTSR